MCTRARVCGIASVSAINGLTSTLIAAGYLYGLLLIIALLGHGLVAVPRRMWRNANKQVLLKQHQVRVSLSLSLSRNPCIDTISIVRYGYLRVQVGRCP